MNRPAGVPDAAWWDEDDGEWVEGPLDAEGEKHGRFRFWRADGTLCAETAFERGVPCGAFRRFHESGEVSQEGSFDDAGELHGTRRWIATDRETSEQTRPAGAGANVWRSETDYRHGKPIATRHFDRHFRRVMLDGAPYPAPPDGVEPGAEWNGASWVLAELDDAGHGDGLRRVWDETGRLVCAAELHGDVLDGRWWRRVPAGTYARRNIRSEKGGFHEGQAIGPWFFFDDEGGVARVLDVGIPRSRAAIAASPVFQNVEREPGEWGALARELMAGRQVGEALCAHARVAAAAHDGTPLREALVARTACMVGEAARHAAEAALSTRDARLATLVDALVRGAAPAPLLQAMAIALDEAGASRAALDFVEAAMLLAPAARELLFSRALIRMSLGRLAEGIADARALADGGAPDGEDDRARFLLDYARVLFPTFDFWPAREPPSTFYDGLPEAPAQGLEAIRSTVRKYAARLTRIRAAMKDRLGGVEPPWIVPDLSGLVDGAPVELERYSFSVDEEEAGPDGEPIAQIEVDETLALEGRELTALLRLARAEWSALTWLCWSAGLDRVALPERLAPPREFGVAAGMSSQRLWRCRDKVHLDGAEAREAAIPGFHWEGMEIDPMPAALARIAEGEYAEMQAVFHWLADARNRSPWQDNLRGS